MTRQRIELFTLIVSLAFPVGLARAQITLDQSFDSGSLDVAQSVIDTTNPAAPEITLEPRRFPSSEWGGNHWWVSFKASGLNSTTPQFRIPTTQTFQPYSNRHRWVYSYDDGASWSFFDNGQVDAGHYQFSNDSAFTSDDVYIAMALPYPASRTRQYTQNLAGNPYVFPTASDNAFGAAGDLVIGQSNDGTLLDTSDGGKGLVPQHDLFGYMITDGSATGQKQKVVLTTGTHSGEPTGTWAHQGFVDFALSNDPAAVELRQKAEIYVYPQVAPDGRWAGYFRSTPEQPQKNHNRYWDNPAGLTALSTVSSAMQTDTGGSADFFFDFHSYGSAQGIGYYEDSNNATSDFFRQRILQLEPSLSQLGGPLPSGAASAWATDPQTLNATVSFTPEHGFLANEPTDRYLEIGENYARAVLDTINNGDPGPGPDPDPDPDPDPRSESVFLDQVAALSPVMHLRLNETLANPDGQTAADATGNHPGTYHQNPALGQDDPFAVTSGTAARFSATADDPQGQHVQVSDFDYTGDDNAFSLAFWFNTEDLSGSAFQYIFSHGTVSQPNSLNIYFIEDGSSGPAGSLRTLLLDGDDPSGFDNAIDVDGLDDGQWHLFSLTVSPADGAIVYIDGLEVGRDADAGGDPFDPATDLFIAGREDLNTERFYGAAGEANGLLDEVMLFDTALGGEALRDLYLSPVPEPATLALLGLGAAVALAPRRCRRSRGR